MKKGEFGESRDSLPKFTTDEVISTMLASAKKERYRDYILLLTLVRTGMRVSDIVKFKKRDIINETIIVRQGKGKKDRVIPLESELGNLLGLYSDNLTPNSRLFDLKVRQVRNIVYKYAPVGLDIHPHTLRHSFAVHCLKNGVNVRNLQKMLGHKHLTTTQVYLDVTAEDVKDDFRKVKW